MFGNNSELKSSSVAEVSYSTVRCIACNQSEWKSKYKVTDTNQDVPGAWEILVCANCGLGVLHPMPSTEEITSFYRDNFYTSDNQRFNIVVETLRRMAAGVRGTGLRKLLPAGGKLLDFGGGSGHFVASMKEYGWDAVNLDIAAAKDDALEPAGFHMEGDAPRLNYPDDHFDAVSLWYVVEHLRNPREAIREFRRVLKPGGVLLLAQQNFASIQAKLFGPRWLILDPPRHIYQFTPSNIARILTEEGFSVARTENASIELGPFTILQSILNTLLGNQNYLFRFLKHKNIKSGLGNEGTKRNRTLLGLLSLGLSVFLGPLSLIFYYALLIVKSGDVFTVYSKKISSGCK